MSSEVVQWVTGPARDSSSRGELVHMSHGHRLLGEPRQESLTGMARTRGFRYLLKLKQGRRGFRILGREAAMGRRAGNLWFMRVIE